MAGGKTKDPFEGADSPFLFLPSCSAIAIMRSLASRFLAGIARVYFVATDPAGGHLS